jgi:hypothetical protein
MGVRARELQIGLDVTYLIGRSRRVLMGMGYLKTAEYATELIAPHHLRIYINLLLLSANSSYHDIEVIRCLLSNWI